MYVLIFKAICMLVWLLFMLIWIRTGEYYEIKRKGASILPVPVLIVLVFAVSFIFPFGWAFFPVSLLGLIIFLIGFLLAIWAKGTLGDNWSAGNQIKMGHELITEVPFSFTRHPVYFSMILMFIGSSLVFGSLTMLGATAVLTVILIVRAYFEEKTLLEEFGEEFVHYQEEVPFIVPRLLSLPRAGREDGSEDEY